MPKSGGCLGETVSWAKSFRCVQLSCVGANILWSAKAERY